MKRRMVFLGFTMVCALVIALIVNGALKSRDETIARLRERLATVSVPVVVAERELGVGARIGQGDAKVIEWPRENVPPGAFMNAQAVFGKVVRRRVEKGEPLVADVLVGEKGAGGKLPLMIPEGMRAVSIPVNEVTDMAGMVLPHARVDVLVSVAGKGGPDGERARIVLQDIEVIAVSHDLDVGSAPRPATVVTLLVTPEQAERLATAMRMGTVSLAMRNYADKARIRTAGVEARQLMGDSEEPSRHAAVHARKARKPMRTIEVIRNGTQRQTVRLIGNLPVSGKEDGHHAPAAQASPDAKLP